MMADPQRRRNGGLVLILGGVVLAAYYFGNSSVTPKTTPPVPISSNNLRYAVSASECEKNLASFRIQLRAFAKDSDQTAEALEVRVEQMEARRLGPEYGARREGDMIANGGCR